MIFPWTLFAVKMCRLWHVLVVCGVQFDAELTVLMLYVERLLGTLPDFQTDLSSLL